MSQNPYSSPEIPSGPWTPARSPQQPASAFVTAPAICLMVVAGISIALLAITIPFDIYLLTSGRAKELERPFDPEISIIIRTIWGLVILAASVYVFYGALQMNKLRNYQTAWAAAIVATIPCVGPCCLLAIPFGVWAIVVLARPEVKAAFTS